MQRGLHAGVLACLLYLGACTSRSPQSASASSAPKTGERTARDLPLEIRATGAVQAIRAYTVQVPRIEGQQQAQNNGRLTLIHLIQNGSPVRKGDVLAEFDRTTQMDAARDAQAKFEDLSHQVRQKAADNRNEVQKRALDLRKAQADLGKALVELKKGPVLAEIDRLQNESKAATARLRVASLEKIEKHRSQAEAAALRILELQSERQKVALERARANAEKLVLRAGISGMAALENIWRGGSMGNAQEGDQLWPGQALLKIFDPGEMEIQALISEPDRAALKPGTPALVRVDAYPDAVFRARFQSSSPVATSAMGSPIKNFAARFRLEQSDARLLPDLSAAVIIRTGENQP